MSVRLSDEEAWAFLTAGHTGVLTTLRADGFPITLPVWFVVDDGAVLVSGPARTKKFSRVRHDDRCSFLVESGERWVELRAVHLTGRASLVADPDWARVDALFDAKYASFRTPREEMPEPTQAHYDGGRELLAIRPEGRFLTWDNRKLR